MIDAGNDNYRADIIVLQSFPQTCQRWRDPSMSPPYLSSLNKYLPESNMAAAEYFEDEVVLDADDLEKLFQAATEFVRTMKNLSDEKRLTFYALFKQVCFLITLCTFAHVM